MHHGRRAEVALDHAHDEVRGIDDDLNPQQAIGVLILGVVDAGDGARPPVGEGAAELADDQVVLVVAGDSDHEVGPRHARHGEPAAFGGVVGEDGGAQLILQVLRLAAVLFEEDDLMTLGRQVVRERGAHLAAAGDDDEHG